MNIERNRRRGRPKKRWLVTIKNDMRAVGCVDVKNQDKWKFKTKVANPK